MLADINVTILADGLAATVVIGNTYLRLILL